MEWRGGTLESSSSYNRSEAHLVRDGVRDPGKGRVCFKDRGLWGAASPRGNDGTRRVKGRPGHYNHWGDRDRSNSGTSVVNVIEWVR